jgi:hypothetical protein
MTQNDNYKSCREGLKPTMTEGKIRRMQAIGFVFDLDKPEVKRKSNRKRAAYMHWDEQFENSRHTGKLMMGVGRSTKMIKKMQSCDNGCWTSSLNIGVYKKERSPT